VMRHTEAGLSSASLVIANVFDDGQHKCALFVRRESAPGSMFYNQRMALYKAA